MRVLTSALAVVALLGLGGLSATALAVDTQVDVPAMRMSGTVFTAPEAGTYRFTIVGGSYCYVHDRAGQPSQYGGWLTKIEIHSGDVTWGGENRWGEHPQNAAASVGDNQHMATAAEAEDAGRGATVTVNMTKGSHVTLLVSDGSRYYRDNSGVVKVRIATDTGTAAPAAVSAAAATVSAAAATPAPAKPAANTPTATPSAKNKKQ